MLNKERIQTSVSGMHGGQKLEMALSLPITSEATEQKYTTCDQALHEVNESPGVLPECTDCL